MRPCDFASNAAGIVAAVEAVVRLPAAIRAVLLEALRGELAAMPGAPVPEPIGGSPAADVAAEFGRLQ